MAIPDPSIWASDAIENSRLPSIVAEKTTGNFYRPFQTRMFGLLLPPKKLPSAFDLLSKKTEGTVYRQSQTHAFGLPMPSKTLLCLRSAVKKLRVRLLNTLKESGPIDCADDILCLRYPMITIFHDFPYQRFWMIAMINWIVMAGLRLRFSTPSFLIYAQYLVHG